MNSQPDILPYNEPPEFAASLWSMIRAFQGTPTFGHLKGVTLVVLGAALWGISGTAAQVLFQRDGFHAGWLVSMRMLTSGFLMLTALGFRIGFRNVFGVWHEKRDIYQLIVFSFLGLAGVQYSYMAAIQQGNAAVATLLQYLSPVFIAFYIVLRTRRWLTGWESLAVFLALVGLFLLVTNGKWNSLDVSTGAIVWGIVSALTAAFYTLFPRSLLHDYGATLVVGWAMVLGGAGLSIFYPPWHWAGSKSPTVWLLLAFVILFGTIIAFTLYLASLKYLSPTETSILASAEPLSASLIAVTMLHLSLTPWAWLGAFCILSTVVVLARYGRKESL